MVPATADESFADFFYNFASDEKLQLSRIVFPLPYYTMEKKELSLIHILEDGEIKSFPMKGTIDATLPNAEKLLMDDPKETAEHATIVDLIRNDLSMVCLLYTSRCV